MSAYLEIAKGLEGVGPEDQDGRRSVGEGIVVIDFGSQYSHLIARRVRDLKVYSVISQSKSTWDTVKHLNPKGVILSGGPASVYEDGAPQAPAWVFDAGVPVLGICYGMQLIAHQLGGVVAESTEREYGLAVIHRNDSSVLFDGLDSEIPVWMSHGDRVETLPPGFRAVAYSENSPIAAMGNDAGIYGIQFHPEVAHTPQGAAILKNFTYKVCGLDGSWTPGNFVAESIARIKAQVGDGKVICALSGGVDSAVTAKLVHEARQFAEEREMQHLYAFVAFAAAQVSAAQGSGDQALDSFTRAEEQALRMQMRPLIWQARAGAAQVLSAAGRTSNAEAKRAEARDMVDEIAGLFKDEKLRSMFLENATSKLA